MADSSLKEVTLKVVTLKVVTASADLPDPKFTRVSARHTSARSITSPSMKGDLIWDTPPPEVD